MKGQLTVRLTDELEEGLEALSRKLHRKRSEVVRIALERFLREEGGAPSDSPYERLKDLLGPSFAMQKPTLESVLRGGGCLPDAPDNSAGDAAYGKVPVRADGLC